ncbi:MAG: replication-associated recombination protein A [Clostridiales bacterium]|nr:replication-associated recombination protein A [Clostridiales bacterium]
MPTDLFDNIQTTHAPLADRMRPETLDEFVGQAHIVGEGRLLRRAIARDALQSSIFFGPPGTGKTTLANIIAHSAQANLVKLNAVSSGVKELRAVLAQAQDDLRLHARLTYLLLDECHRWSKAQSDALLPALEAGVVRLIGSTTENPMISMTGALVSRCRLFQFYPLTAGDIEKALRRALADTEKGYGKLSVHIEDDAMVTLISLSNGDCRNAYNALELAVESTEPGADGVIHITKEIAAESAQRKVILCDEQLLYDMLSAFCKSLRGSHSDAALAWFARMITAGMDPRIIARRLIAHASEDVGLANPTAMQQAVAAAQALELIGMPEARLPLAQAIIYLCESPKSNSVVCAVDAALADAQTGDAIFAPVPIHLRDTSFAGAKKLGHGTGYKYPHDYPGHWLPQQYLPEELRDAEYYVPSDQGQEAKIKENHEKKKKL